MQGQAVSTQEALHKQSERGAAAPLLPFLAPRDKIYPSISPPNQRRFSFKNFRFESHHGGYFGFFRERNFEKNFRTGHIKTRGAGVPVPGFGFRGGESMGQGTGPERGLVDCYQMVRPGRVWRAKGSKAGTGA